MQVSKPHESLASATPTTFPNYSQWRDDARLNNTDSDDDSGWASNYSLSSAASCHSLSRAASYHSFSSTAGGQLWPVALPGDSSAPSSAGSEAEGSTTEDGHYGKRKRSIQTSRSWQARFALPMPFYEVKSSPIAPGQQLALDWCTRVAKQDFERLFRNVLALVGGVGPSHCGTCVLCPRELYSLSSDPAKLHALSSDPAELIRAVSHLPRDTSAEMMYQYSDYETTLTRSIAWFRRQWPRPMTHLDMFIGDRPGFEATFLCNQDHCLLHVVSEDAETKESRKICVANARLVRQAGQDLPGECSMHDPPCLLQHTTLTTAEVYHIQSDILRQATGLHLTLGTVRPEVDYLHAYPTFESHLPLAWELSTSALKVDPKDIVRTIPSGERPRRPVFSCHFCSSVKAKSFRSVNGLWGHIFHKHTDVETSDRLGEIRRTAAVWVEYCLQSSEGGKEAYGKAVQAGQEDFDWAVVAAWKLRGYKASQESKI